MEKTVTRKIGLVAHDAMKKDLIEWVLWNSERLMGHKFYCTGTTGSLSKKALQEKHPDVEWDIVILKSGPLGGDQQIGSRIVEGEIDYLFFFTDPMTLQPHDTDVKHLRDWQGGEYCFLLQPFDCRPHHHQSAFLRPELRADSS